MKTEPRDLDRRFYEGFRAGTELFFDLLERKALSENQSMLEIAERIGCSIATIRDIDRGRSYQGVE